MDTAVPTTKATRYINAFPTTGNTKIPPCGAINVQSKNIDNAPATAEPTINAGIVLSGSAEANGIVWLFYLFILGFLTIIYPCLSRSFTNL